MHGKRAAATSVRLEVSSDVRLVDLVHSAAERVAELAGFDPDEGLNVGLAVREAVINAIVHGNGNDPSLKVTVTFKADEDLLTAKVRDQGAGFDPGTAPDPTAAPHLLKTSGRGLLLMRAFVDEIRFRRRRGRGMEITLKKAVPSREGAE